MRDGGRKARRRRGLLAAGLAGALVSSGCAGVAVTLLGVSTGVAASTTISYTLDGTAYRTFTASLPVARTAALTALKRMGMKLESQKKKEDGETILARGVDREIEVGLDILSPKTTRISTVARHGFLYIFRDRATATEIILQTEKALGELN